MADVPDIYSDLFNIFANPMGIIVVLHRAEPPTKAGSMATQAAQPVGVLRFSLENWKAMLMTGRKQLKNQETSTGAPVKLPEAILGSLGLTEADW